MTDRPLAILLSPDDQIIQEMVIPEFKPVIQIVVAPSYPNRYTAVDDTPLFCDVKKVSFVPSLLESELATMANGYETIIYRQEDR